MTNKASSVLAYESVQRDYPPIRLVVVILTSMASVCAIFLVGLISAVLCGWLFQLVWAYSSQPIFSWGPMLGLSGMVSLGALIAALAAAHGMTLLVRGILRGALWAFVVVVLLACLGLLTSLYFLISYVLVMGDVTTDFATNVLALAILAMFVFAAIGLLYSGIRAIVRDRKRAEEIPRRAVGLGLYLEDVGVAAAYAVAALAVLVFIVPKYREVFKDFKTALPALTELVLWCASLAQNGEVSVLLTLAFAGLVPVPFALMRMGREGVLSTKRRILSRGIALIVFVLFFLLPVVIALMLPMVKLVRSISGEGG